MSGLRSIVGILLGVVVAMVVYWIGAVIALLSMHGIPLGSPGGPPTTADILANIAAAAAGSFCGVRVAVGLARRSPAWHGGAVTLVLAVIAIQGFGKPSSNWPPWFGVAMAVASAGGALAATRSSRPRG